MPEEYPVILESVQDPEDGSFIHKCGAYIVGKTVLLTVRDPRMPLAGSGDVVRQVVPYCPDCGPEPSGYGTILATDTPAAREETMLRRLRETD